MSTRVLWIAVPVWLVAIIFTACGGGSESPASPSTVTTPTASTSTTASSGSESTTTAAVAYVNDIKPILDSDCIVCHGPRVHEDNVQLDTYANVMRVVQAGNANSLLVLVTRTNGIMYPNLTGDRAAKSELIRAWVVNNNAAETR
jgi:hypothetical protein